MRWAVMGNDFRVALVAAALAGAGVPIYIHLPQFAVSELGLSLGQVGLLLMAVRVIDFVQDPLLGALIDRAGKGRALIGPVALFGLALGLIWVFALTPFGGGLAGLAAGLVVTFTAYSLGTLLLYGQSANLAGSGAQKAQLRLAGAREFGVLAGVTAGAMGPQLLGTLFAAGGGESGGPAGGGYAAFGVMLAGVCVLAAIMARPLWTRPMIVTAPLNWRIFTRSGAGWLLLLGFFNTLPVAITATLFFFFVELRLELPQLGGPFLLLFFLCGGLSAPWWARLAGALGPRRVLSGAMCLAIAGFVWAYLVPAGDAWAFALICVFSGVALGADSVILTSALVTALSGHGAQAAQAFGLWNFLSKAALALAAGAMLPFLESAGLGSAGAATRDAIDALNASYALVPCALKLVSLLVLQLLPARIFAPGPGPAGTAP